MPRPVYLHVHFTSLSQKGVARTSESSNNYSSHQSATFSTKMDTRLQIGNVSNKVAKLKENRLNWFSCYKKKNSQILYSALSRDVPSPPNTLL